jgi:hypothetical protein
VAVTHSVGFAQHWSNDFEISLTSSRELQAGMPMDRGFTVRNELGRSWERWSATGYLYHTISDTSVAGLLLNNPQLLPERFRESFQADPVRFILTNQDALPALLAGIELPAPRQTNVGLRWQGVFSRYTFSGDLRFSSNEILAQERRELLASFGASIRLDAANSLQISGARSLALTGTSTPSVLTLSYTHRFGVSSGEGFHFGRLFGLDRGRVQGRVFFDLNANGEDDEDEPGIPGIKIQLDETRSLTSDDLGRFDFSSIKPGDHKVALVSEELGVSMRASTPTEQQVFLSARQTIKIAFGITSSGFVAGRIFNDLYLKGDEETANLPGIRDVSISLRSESAPSDSQVLSMRVDASGAYEFRNLKPGRYILEMDPMSLPPDFRLPVQTSWVITVEPLRGKYLDIPLAAERAVLGVVFRDRDNDRQFDPNKDEPIKGACVSAGQSEAFTDSNGSFILRDLPAGNLQVHAWLASGEKTPAVNIKLEAEPGIRRNVTLIADL